VCGSTNTNFPGATPKDSNILLPAARFSAVGWVKKAVLHFVFFFLLSWLFLFLCSFVLFCLENTLLSYARFSYPSCGCLF
jgi:hypothetical protein